MFLIEKTKHELKAAIAELKLEAIDLRELNEHLQRRLDEEARRLARGAPAQAASGL